MMILSAMLRAKAMWAESNASVAAEPERSRIRSQWTGSASTLIQYGAGGETTSCNASAGRESDWWANPKP